ncbi:MAG: hypothetical protein ABWU13_19550, partial [Limnospira maxima]
NFPTLGLPPTPTSDLSTLGLSNFPTFQLPNCRTFPQLPPPTCQLSNLRTCQLPHSPTSPNSDLST